MAKYRDELPQLGSRLFLSDGGMETTLIFLEGIDLPHFASFVLLADEDGRSRLTDYYETYLRLARDRGAGFVFDTPTWRASPDWAPLLGYDLPGLAAANEAGIHLGLALRRAWETAETPIVINGAIGPRGDGYKAGRMKANEAENYHSFQVGVFARGEADMVSAITMNTIDEAVGIARAASAHAIPCVVSFTVETDGRLVDGTSLRAAIERTDEETGGSPAYYMINCAHPSHFEPALRRGEAWIQRIAGIRANASAKSHAELDEATELDVGDIADLGRRYRGLTDSFPAMRVLGGCCGTDHRHVRAICEAVSAPAAS